MSRSKRRVSWKREYTSLLEQGRAAGEINLHLEKPDKRRHPRFTVKSGFVRVWVEPKFSVINISVSGIAYYSDYPFLQGNYITINFDKATSGQAEIISCEMEASDEAFLETRYRVQAKFLDERLGMQLLVTIKELENSTAGSAVPEE